MAEIDITIECCFKFKKSAGFAKEVISIYSGEKISRESFEEIKKKLLKSKYDVEDLFIKGCNEFDVTGPFEINDKKFRFGIWGGSEADGFFEDLAIILTDLKVQEIFAIYYHDDGFQWIDALDEGQLKTIYNSDTGLDYDNLLFEDDPLSSFIELYKQNKLVLPSVDVDKLVELCRQGKDFISVLFRIDDINAPDSKGELPLIAAVKAGIYENVMFMCEQTNPNAMAENSSGETAMSVAIEMGNKKIIELLKDYSYDPNSLTPDAVEKAHKSAPKKIQEDPSITKKIKHLAPEDDLSVQLHPVDDSLRMIIPGGDRLEGIIDGSGNVILAPEYVSVASFSEGVAYVRKNWEEEGYFIDLDGKPCLDIRCSDKTLFNGGIAAIHYGKPRRSALIDTTGTIIVEFDPEYYFGVINLFHEPSKLIDDRVPVKKNMLSGFMDSSGKVIVEPQFEDASNFIDKRARYSQKNIDGIIDTEGNKILEGRFNWLTHYSEGIAIGSINGITKYYDIDGNVLFENDYYRKFLNLNFHGRSFRNGLLAVHEGFKGWGFINKDGQLAIECEFDEVGDFLENVTFANYKGQWGLLTIEAEFRPFKMKRPKLAEPRFYLRNEAKGVFGVIDRKVLQYEVSAFINLEGEFIYRHGFKK